MSAKNGYPRPSQNNGISVHDVTNKILSHDYIVDVVM